MPNRNNIDKWTVGYFILKNIITKPFYNHYYGKKQMVNKGIVPKGKSTIIAPNHQNALMDAMAFVMGLNFQTVFLARADMFKKEFIARILTFMKILPIFRIRDGMSSLQKNDEIFDITVNVLKNKRNPLLLFPEGNHGERRRLRPLVKGIFRIAFKAQAEFKDQNGVQIIPAGIDYNDYSKFRQSVLVQFGEPIEVCEYWQDYEENQALAINKLRERLAEEMRKVMIDIQSEEYYQLYMDLRKIYGPTMRRNMKLKKTDLYTQFIADKKMIASLDECLEKSPEKIKQLNSVYSDYVGLRDKLRLRDWVPQKKTYSIILNVIGTLFSIVLWPLVLLGLFNNWPHYFIAPKIRKKIKDTQFQSTAIWGAGMVIAWFYYAILVILALIFIPGWHFKIAYVITMFTSGAFALSYRNFIVKSMARIRYAWGMRKSKSETRQMKEKFDQILDQTDRIVVQYSS